MDLRFGSTLRAEIDTQDALRFRGERDGDSRDAVAARRVFPLEVLNALDGPAHEDLREAADNRRSLLRCALARQHSSQQLSTKPSATRQPVCTSICCKPTP